MGGRKSGMENVGLQDQGCDTGVPQAAGL